MVNNIKLYFYRFSKSISTIVCAVLLVIFAFLPTVLSFFILLVQGMSPADFGNVNIFEEFIGQFEMITLLVLIFTTVFLANDEKNGFIKNMVSVQKRRLDIFISRAVFVLFYLAAAVLLSFIFYFISYKIFFRSTAQFQITSELAAKFGVMMLVSYAILLTVAMLGVLSRGIALPLTLGLLYLLNFFSLIIAFFNVLVIKITGIKTFDASCILLANFYNDSFGTDLQRILVPSLYIVISSVTAMIVLEKRDVR